MLQVSHQPSFVSNIHEPRCPPNPPPSSPVLRQQIVRMIKNITKATKQKPATAEIPRRPFTDLNQQNDYISKRCQSPLRKPVNNTIHHGKSTDKENKCYNENTKCILEKQSYSLPVGSIRRLPQRPQRQHTNISHQQNSSQDRNGGLIQSVSSNNNNRYSCEVKGLAINQSPVGSASAQKQRMEVHTRAQKLSASISELKRRLMKNRNKVHPSSGEQADTYNVFPSKPSRTATPLHSSNPQTPRTPISRRSPIEGGKSNQVLTSQAKTQDGRIAIDSPSRLSFHFSGKESAKQIHPVETYVLIENQQERIRGKFQEPVALSVHNLSMHDMFIEMDEKKKKDPNSANTRKIHKWLDTVESCYTRPHRIVRFNMGNSSSSAGGSLSDSSY